MSQGGQNAMNTANLLAGKRHHKNGDNDFDRSDIGRSDWGRSDSGQFWSKYADQTWRNRYCIALGVNIALLVYTGYEVWNAGSLGNASTWQGEGASYLSDSENFVYGVNAVSNLNSIRSSGYGIYSSAQNCHMKSL